VKKRIIVGIMLLMTLGFSLTGCKSIAKNMGGTITIDVPKGQKIIEATWKGSNLWYLTRPMREDEEPEAFTLQEDSNFGIMEGKVIFKESK
jgi:hypothetical protein